MIIKSKSKRIGSMVTLVQINYALTTEMAYAYAGFIFSFAVNMQVGKYIGYISILMHFLISSSLIGLNYYLNSTEAGKLQRRYIRGTYF